MKSPSEDIKGIAWLLPSFLQLFHKDRFPSSPPKSPPHSTINENTILPISAPSHSVSFKGIDQQVLPIRSPSWRMSLPTLQLPVLVVILLFPISSALVLFSLSTLPISISWPQNISDLAQLGRELHSYCKSGSGPLLRVIFAMSLSAIWTHAWSIPGSVLWNVLAGALFSPLYATILLTVLTALGSACSTLLSKPLSSFISRLSPRALDLTRQTLSGDYSTSSLHTKASPGWARLSILRFIGVVPWSGINIACGVCDVAIADCMLGAFIGCLPWTAVTCQIGDILQKVASTPSPTPQSVQSLITKPEILLKLVVLTIISSAPILCRSRLQPYLLQWTKTGKWVWVGKLRSKIRFQPSSSVKDDHLQLEALVHEKVILDDFSSS